MRATPRQNEILRLVRLEGSCGIGDLAQRLNVSEETIRRNIKPLTDAGMVEKVHGAIVLPQPFFEPPIQRRMLQNQGPKRRIAAEVAGLVHDGDSVMLDTGSTTAYVAQALANHANLTVVTNSSYIANLLSVRNDNRVFMAGGELRAHDAAAFGVDAIAFVERFQVRYAILSMGALRHDTGFMDFHLCEAEFSRAVIGQAEQVVVAVDHSKFESTSLVRVCGPDQVDILVTDEPPPPPLSAVLDEAGTRVIIADR